MNDSKTERLVWAPSALADMASIIALGSDAEERLLLEGVRRIAASPYMGERALDLRPTHRRFIWAGYQIIYRATRGRHHWGDEITIVAIRRLGDDTEDL